MKFVSFLYSIIKSMKVQYNLFPLKTGFLNCIFYLDCLFKKKCMLLEGLDRGGKMFCLVAAVVSVAFQPLLDPHT